MISIYYYISKYITKLVDFTSALTVYIHSSGMEPGFMLKEAVESKILDVKAVCSRISRQRDLDLQESLRRQLHETGRT